MMGERYKVARNLDVDQTGDVLVANRIHLHGWFIHNANAATLYVKLYNKATAPDENDTPVLTIPIGAGGSANVEFVGGIEEFPDGIGCRATTGVADDDTGAPDANDVILNLMYK